MEEYLFAQFRRTTYLNLNMDSQLCVPCRNSLLRLQRQKKIEISRANPLVLSCQGFIFEAPCRIPERSKATDFRRSFQLC